MPTRNINLTDHLDKFVEVHVKSGRYGNASEVVREGLRLLEQHEREEAARIEWLRGAVNQGIAEIERGEGLAFESMDELESYVHGLGEEISSRGTIRRKRL
ncbi:MAG: type II toxin-antitoxin system ParD family antitoxin [Bryobacterales bacterium]|nr:type II toxin-antitoxin system ParD family antitoxin [Bryobacterales bacterium]